MGEFPRCFTAGRAAEWPFVATTAIATDACPPCPRLSIKPPPERASLHSGGASKGRPGWWRWRSTRGGGALTWHHHALPWWLILPLGGWLVAWHGSLQHEVLHGHPTRWQGLNTVLASAPLVLWLPYPLYYSRHRRHHIIASLTDPLEDPESFYVEPAR